MNPFGLPNQQLAAFSRPVLEYLPAGYDAEDVAQAEIEDVESLAELASPEVVAARIARMGVNVSAENMTERLLEDSHGRTVISGLRYRNLDPEFPFVAVKTTTRVNDSAAVDALAGRVATAYRGVEVRGFTFSEQPGLELPHTESWATVVAGSLAQAATAGGQDLDGALQISWPDAATEVFADYQDAHHRWRTESPELAPFVPASDEEELQDAADQGLLMVLRDAGGFAGLAAATISPLFGRRAVYMVEIFLPQRLRGKGLAPQVESVFLAGQRSEADTVWGHIYAGNLPSLRTAQKLGRRAVQQEYFVSLTAY